MFETLNKTAPDAIVEMIKIAAADTSPKKIDLGVGIYQDEVGATPVMRAVKKAERLWFDEEDSKKYIGIHGNPEFNRLFSELTFGDGAEILTSGRLAVAQSAGGSGALRLGTELIKMANPGTTVWVSTPTWANHTPLIGSTGLPVKPYPYYNKETQTIDFDDMCATLRNEAKPGDVVVLHGCCHNPTGADLSQDQWRIIADLLIEKSLMPFVDLAYTGLGDGLDADTFGLRLLVDKCPELVLATSCSKNFGLYRERTGMVAAIARTPEEADLCRSQIGLIMRRMISMPPDHGAALVAKILSTPDLKADWLSELETMRLRMSGLRQSLAEALSVQGAEQMANAIASQKGMFSLLPVSPEQAEKLRSEHSVYLLNSGRINIAGARAEMIDGLADAILAVL
ncbi:MAG: aspartate/tyrosine/aromatic aminotransferase [Hyphomonadaceae bacterium]|nr:aspartate/tyrosine/aromatic aminotransferase [Hyphomonadaceae bacterium]